MACWSFCKLDLCEFNVFFTIPNVYKKTHIKLHYYCNNFEWPSDRRTSIRGKGVLCHTFTSGVIIEKNFTENNFTFIEKISKNASWSPSQ